MNSKVLAQIILFTGLLYFIVPCVFSQASNISNSSLINITLIEPKFGASQVDTFDLIVKTSNYSDCRYSQNPALNYSEITSPLNIFTTTNHYYHTLPNFQVDLADNEKKMIYVLCKTDTGYVNDRFPQNITLSVDRTPPVFVSAIAQPQLAIEKVEVILRAETDDETTCSFEKYTPNPAFIQVFFNSSTSLNFSKISTYKLIPPNIDDNMNYTYFVVCMNRAKLLTEEIRTVTFAVNKSYPNFILKTLPQGYINSTDTVILVETNRDSTCKYGQDNKGYTQIFPQEHAKVHFIQKQGLEEGRPYTFQVRCDIDQGLPATIESEISFIIDKTRPDSVSVAAPSQTCVNTSLSANFSVNASDLKTFKYIVTDSSDNIISQAFTNSTKIIISNISLKRGDKYFWQVYAIDIAGNNGTMLKNSGTSILPDDNELCKPNMAPYAQIGAARTESGITVGLNCTDDDGICSGTKYLLINSKNPGCSCGECDYASYSAPVSGISENSTFCYSLQDNKNKTTESNFTVFFKTCSAANETNCCAGKIGMLCIGTCQAIQSECDLTKADSDSDSIADSIETGCGLNPINQSDALSDSDKDGLSNKEECITYHTLFNKPDSDDDGFNDKEELDKGTDPNNKLDFPKDPNKDTDEDGITDDKEKECGLDPDKGDANQDNDDDGISNKLECLTYYTKVDKIDSDDDTYSDKKEIDAGTDPLDSESFPKSHLLNIVMFIIGIGAIGGGIFMFSQQGPKDMSMKSTAAFPSFSAKQPAMQAQQPKPIKKGADKPFIADSPFINFKETRAEIQHEVSQQPIPQKTSFSDPLDHEIQKKREFLKMKSMSSIFDEFAHENLDYDKQKIGKKEEYMEQKQEEREKTFRRLEDLSDENAFEKLEKISKKERNPGNNLTNYENEKLDRLSSRGRRR